MNTHNLEQYAVVIGRKAYCYKRNKKKSQEYRRPNFIGVQWFRNSQDAAKFKEEFDKPITH